MVRGCHGENVQISRKSCTSRRKFWKRQAPGGAWRACYDDWDNLAEGTASARKGTSRKSKISTFTKQFNGTTKSTPDTDLFLRLSINLYQEVD